MEKEQPQKAEDSYQTSLLETGECRIPLAREEQAGVPFVQLLDAAREYGERLANILDEEVVARCGWDEELGYHYLIQTITKFEQEQAGFKHPKGFLPDELRNMDFFSK